MIIDGGKPWEDDWDDAAEGDPHQDVGIEDLLFELERDR
jgi:hypothetical protein